LYIALISNLGLPCDDRKNSGFDAKLKGAAIRAGKVQAGVLGRWAACNKEFRTPTDQRRRRKLCLTW